MASFTCEALSALRFDDTFDGTVRMQEPLSKHTTYRIGGPAAYWIQVDSLAALRTLSDVCDAYRVPWTTLGKGSNVLASDGGFDGVVVSLGRDFKTWFFNPDTMQFKVGAGATLARVVQEAFHLGVTGLEFAVGTPGTIGGALRMNAGSRDEWLGEHIASVTTFSPGHGRRFYQGDQIDWAYRYSSLPADEIVLQCLIDVETADPDSIRQKMETLLARRRGNQPLEFPSCGSVFKNPDGHSAGALIEEVGLKGQRVGGAQISDKHANFIVNVDHATADDVLSLIHTAQTKVKERYGIELQPEVRFLGFA